MEMDVNLSRASALELKTISAGSYSTSNAPVKNYNNNVPASRSLSPLRGCYTPQEPPASRRAGCCGILGHLLCLSGSGVAKTASSSHDCLSSLGQHAGASLPPPAYAAIHAAGQRKVQPRRRTPQEIYFESRGKSCKKLLKFNGNSNKILLYPEEGWARTASSSYWTITPCWWQPNRCRIEEFTGTQRRQATKAKMVPLEQGSLLIAGHFRSKKNAQPSNNNYTTGTGAGAGTGTGGGRGGVCDSSKNKDGVDEFKLYLSSNISMEDYNMGYCLTGFVERRCQQTNTFQMTHFAVIKRQWPSISSDTSKST